MPLIDKAGSIQACALRIARLAADGSTPAGANNMYVTDAFTRLQASPEVAEGETIEVVSACGGRPIDYREPNRIRRLNLTLELVDPDPEIAELVGGFLLITGDVVTDLATTSASAVISSATARFKASDVGATITGAGIPAGTTILSVQSLTQATMSAAATVTGSNVSATIGRSVGAGYPKLDTALAPNGVSLELWTKAAVGANLAPRKPYKRWALGRTYGWTPGDREWANNAMGNVFTGFANENTNWGNGPNNDWTGPSGLDARVIAWMRDSALPTLSEGYLASPAQV